jgi:hypothetical protein
MQDGAKLCVEGHSGRESILVEINSAVGKLAESSLLLNLGGLLGILSMSRECQCSSADKV